LTKSSEFAVKQDVVIPQSTENLLFAQMKYYLSEMQTYQALLTASPSNKYFDLEILQNATRVCAMAETIGILTGAGEDAVMGDFHKWMEQMKLPREDRDGKYRRNNF